jgi:MFS transporter, ACS family, allantoate permease
VQYIFQIALANANCAGYTKKATLGAVMFIAYCASMIAGPQVFRSDEAPVYRTAFLSNFVCFALLISTIWIFHAYLIWENRRRDKLVLVEGLDPINEDYDEAFRDRTDWQQKKTFRYVY